GATNVMGYVLLRQKKMAEAEPYVREAIAISRRTNGEDHRDTLIYVHNLGRLLLEQHKPSAAEPHFREVLEKGGRTLGPEDPLTISALMNLAGLLIEQRRFAEAVRLLAASEPAARKVSSPEGERTLARLLEGLGRARKGLEQFEAAEA